jgi:tRNA(Ile)-lysidine synthase
VNDLPAQLDQTIRERGLFRRGQKILVAVSGGVDSMVLLHALNALAKRNQWQLTIAHLNHQLRGRSSDADERLVTRTAKSFGLPVVAARVDVKKLARTGKLSIEMAARKARHEFLAQTAARLKISHIALAHHADDQVELFFLRLFRGAGSEGLAGM